MTKIMIDESTVQDVVRQLSPWICHDDKESCFLGDVEKYINNVKINVARSNYFQPDDEYDWEMIAVCSYGEAMSYFKGRKKLPPLQDSEHDKYMVILDENGPLNGDRQSIENNSLPVFVSVIPDDNEKGCSYIIYYYFFPYQDKTYSSIGITVPGTAHTADWESIIVHVRDSDALNPIRYGMTQHGNIEWVKDMEKVKQHFPGDSTKAKPSSFFISRNVHSIYDHAGDTELAEVLGISFSIDYHRGALSLLRGGRPVIINYYDQKRSTVIDQNARDMLSWSEDWGFHVGTLSYSTFEDDIVEEKTAVSPLNYSKLP